MTILKNKYMREIKFRVWDKEENRMEDWEDIKNGVASFLLENKRFIPLQYTGLKDKNGKEIYEGDIVIGMHYEEIDTGVGIDKLSIDGENMVVKWENDMSGWNLYGWDEFRVIGNICQNPELLNK